MTTTTISKKQVGIELDGKLKCVTIGEAYCNCVANRPDFDAERTESRIAKADAEAELFSAKPGFTYCPSVNLTHSAWKAHLWFVQDSGNYIQCPTCRRVIEIVKKY